MWILFLLSNALAAPVGEPVAHPDRGVLSVRTLGDFERVQTQDDDCNGEEPCGAEWSTATGALELQWSPRPGLGLSVDVGYLSARISQAKFRGDGPAVGLSLRGALPISQRWWLAGMARWAGSSVDSGGAGGVQEQTRTGVGTLAAMIAWSEIKEGPSIWFGAQSSLLWRQTLYPMGVEDELSIPLRPNFPVSAVAGLSLRSRPVGLPWEDSARISIGMESRFGQALGVGTWVEVAW